MTAELTRVILERAHALDSMNLDAQARSLGAVDWQTMTGELEFSVCSTGGGCTVLTAGLPQGCNLEITDGEAGVPVGVEGFWLGVMNQDGEERLSLFSDRSVPDTLHQEPQA